MNVNQRCQKILSFVNQLKLQEIHNYLLEEVETRKNQILQNVNIDDKIISHIEGDDFKNMFLNHIKGDYGQKLNQEVAFMVFEKIDESIQDMINARVDARLREVGVNVPDTVN